jgi:hypothetical protein
LLDERMKGLKGERVEEDRIKEEKIKEERC